MSAGRWFEIATDAAAAAEHFARSVDLFRAGGFADDSLDGYRARMALMHAMQSGHTSLESALVRVLRLIGEDVPTGGDWHADLIRRAASIVAGRPAILPEDAARAANETRRFRHVAMRSYGSFDATLAEPSVRAAELLAGTFPAAIAAFRRVIDPPTGQGR